MPHPLSMGSEYGTIWDVGSEQADLTVEPERVP